MVLVIGVGRVVTILPNKMIGVIGEHAEYPIERLAFSHDRTTLGSASHDNTVKVRVCTRLFHENQGIIMSCHAAVFVPDDATLV
jgi:hypothetical protein